jgi:hypothetical protein
MLNMLRPMPEQRQNLLVKCAGDVVDLCNCSVEPTEALTKVAAESDLNAHEIDRVSHKVNQALTLGYLQSSAPENRGKAFPLTNAEQAKAKIFKEQPETTETELAKGQTFNPIKTASELDYVDSGDYNTYGRKYDLVKIANDIRVPTPDLPSPVKRPTAGQEKIAYEIAREAYQAVRNELSSAMSAATQPFIYAGSPDFGGVAKVAQDMGVSAATLDTCFGLADLGKYGQKKTASTSAYVNTKLAKDFVRVEQLISACGVAKSQMDEAKTALDKAQANISSWIAKQAADAPSLAKVDYGGATEQVEGIFDQALGGNANGPSGMIGEALGIKPGDNGPVAPAGKSLHEKDVDQGVRNTDARSVLQDAMHDPYISGHGVTKVVDAINRANSLHPNLSSAEIMSYVRQDLATDGGVPLDTHLRMVQAHKDKV